MPLTILADDLTGACDTGALFTGAGPVAASTRQVTHSSTPSRRRGWTRHASIPTLPPPTGLWRISSRSSVPGGDILPDLGAATVGGLGMAPSGDIGDRWALFQPSHGTAPDIASKGIANPLAMILSAAMLLQWLGDRHADAAARAAAERIERAVAAVLATGTAKTRDIGGSAATREVGDAGLRAL